MTVKTCYCSQFEFGTWTAEVPQGADPNDYYETYSTECGKTTTRIFAQGHDAKLVGYLVRAQMAGEEITLTEGGVRVTFTGAVQAASHVSDALALKAADQLAAALARATKKANKPVKTPKQAMNDLVERQTAQEPTQVEVPVVEEPPAPTTRDAKIKVGRWTYDAVIELADGEAHYFSKLGTAKVAKQGEYTEV